MDDGFSFSSSSLPPSHALGKHALTTQLVLIVLVITFAN